ncbi:hypothetical protein SASC598P14_005730 [Snodgrassella alvi SCGC AB-598-P14]|nr:hypothetical protein SASC598P14_005730 [Snodgrassella alvi SCGC AB-598-P14]
MADQILEFNRAELFKKFPVYSRYHISMSEYLLFKSLQPKLNDVLFIGKGYEASFDDFEVLFTLVVADIIKKESGHMWFPIGHFGYKITNLDSPLTRIIDKAKFL